MIRRNGLEKKDLNRDRGQYSGKNETERVSVHGH